MNETEARILRGMAKIKKAIIDAPSHLEQFAGFEALLRHLHAPDEPAPAPVPDMGTQPPATPANLGATAMLHASLAHRPS